MMLERREGHQYFVCEYEKQVCNAMLRLIRPGTICADVAAHLDYFTLLIAKVVGSTRKIYAFEAFSDNAALLETNVGLTEYDHRVVVENKAVGDKTCAEMELHLGPSSFESSLAPHQDSESITVPAVSLGDYFAEADKLDFMKIDIEDAELYAIPAMRDVPRQLRPTILLEIHSGAESAVEELLSLDYRLLDLDFQPIVPPKIWDDKIAHIIASTRF